MDTYVVPITFPDLDSAKRDAKPLAEALRTAGVHAQVVDGPGLDGSDDAGRRDPGPITRELQVHGDSVDEVRTRVQEVMDGQFPAGMLLLGEPTKA